MHPRSRCDALRACAVLSMCRSSPPPSSPFRQSLCVPDPCPSAARLVKYRSSCFGSLKYCA